MPRYQARLDPYCSVASAQVEDLALAGAAPRVGYRLRTVGERSLPDTGQEVIERTSRFLSTALERPETDVIATMEVRHNRRASHAKGRVAKCRDPR